MEQMQKLVQTVIPIALFNFLHALYRASGDQKTLTSKLDSDIVETDQRTLTNGPDYDIIETKRVGSPPKVERNPKKTERVSDLPPWIRKIGRNYMFRYLRGVTTEEGYKKVMSRRGRSPGREKR